jgi:hypothetical protein
MVRNLPVTFERLEAIGVFCQNQSLMKILERKLEISNGALGCGEHKVTRNIKSASLENNAMQINRRNLLIQIQ